MRRLARAAAITALSALAAPSQAAEPSLSVQGAAGSTTAQQAQSLATQALGLAAGAGAGSGPMLYLDPVRPARAMPGFGALDAADQSLALAGDKVYETMRALGDAADRGAVLQRRDNMYYVGIDGEGGRWFASAGEAIGFMFQGMVAKSSKFNYSTKQSAVYGCAQDILCAILAVVQDPYFTIATVTRGSTVNVSIAGKGFSSSGGGPSVASGDGILVQSVAYLNPENIAAVLQIAPTARLGEHMLGVFNAGQGFQNAGVYKLAVKDGVGAAPVTASSSRATAQALSLTAATSGMLAGDGAEQFWRIDVAAAGTLTVSSSGGADVKATLEDSGGAALASDDDAGGWYNFKLARAVAPGTYYLRVGHCCAGAGAYTLSATLTP
ncbi:MAG: PPC domain-containing protein [Rhodospirillales bacterium]